MTQPEETIDSILKQLVEDCHGIVHEQFMSVIDKNPAFDRTKARLNSLIEGIIGKKLPELNWGKTSDTLDIHTAGYHAGYNAAVTEQRKRLKLLGGN